MANSAIAVTSDTIDYTTGAKELNLNNWTGTAIDTTMNLDPVRALSFGKLHAGMILGMKEDIIGAKNEVLQTYAAQEQRFEPGELAPNLRKAADKNDPARPQLTDYSKLSQIRHQLRNYTAPESPGGPPSGKIGGYDIGSEFDKIDFTRQENYTAYRAAMNRMMSEQEKIMIDNNKGNQLVVSSWLPFARRPEQAEKYDAAQGTVAILNAAEKEFSLFEQRVLAYKRQSAEAPVAPKLPNANTVAMAPGKPSQTRH